MRGARGAQCAGREVFSARRSLGFECTRGVQCAWHSERISEREREREEKEEEREKRERERKESEKREMKKRERERDQRPTETAQPTGTTSRTSRRETKKTSKKSRLSEPEPGTRDSGLDFRDPTHAAWALSPSFFELLTKQKKPSTWASGLLKGHLPLP